MEKHEMKDSRIARETQQDNVPFMRTSRAEGDARADGISRMRDRQCTALSWSLLK